ncbi:hypothetical protein BO86DRAFT_411496 [Aspergillus japonicus CBS 114.51]|uniref:Uncharacterized protein n=1 Tax=Aspergillus japonicus CBS 114.51 TaxID=1448312 RepID=A0A8T8WUI8_ASPJA|nr:hypothetical protein BO86DRAFT_411496 [Aspergillus japonicus CBS 114.51]RAH79508.1 hypothetical protein BO86DRAFT_411496 [Aspergillus japonicus CBS 114.51]
MASKCWFVLQQTHYPPPDTSRTGKPRGPICLGHLIPSLKRLDEVINRHGPLDLPLDMPIYTTKATDLTWAMDKSEGIDVSASVGVPIAAAAGLTAQLGAGVAFKRTVKKYWEFESLDTLITQPTREYVEESVEDDEVRQYLESRLLSSSSVFMITGIMIARGARVTASNDGKRALHAEPGVSGIAGLAEAGFDGSLATETHLSNTAQQATDFVWAVRLAKISKGVVDRRWSHRTFSRGATFGVEQDKDVKRQLVDALKEEGVHGLNVQHVDEGDEVFIVNMSSG